MCYHLDSFKSGGLAHWDSAWVFQTRVTMSETRVPARTRGRTAEEKPQAVRPNHFPQTPVNDIFKVSRFTKLWCNCSTERNAPILPNTDKFILFWCQIPTSKTVNPRQSQSQCVWPGVMWPVQSHAASRHSMDTPANRNCAFLKF